MKNSINYPFLVGTVLIGLWITPIFGRMLANQTPFLARLGEPVNFTITGENVSNAVLCMWFKGYDVENATMLSEVVMNTGEITNRRAQHITIDRNCTLIFDRLTEADLDRYTFVVFFRNGLLKDYIFMNGAPRFELSSIAVLALAGLVSSFTLF